MKQLFWDPIPPTRLQGTFWSEDLLEWQEAMTAWAHATLQSTATISSSSGVASAGAGAGVGSDGDFEGPDPTPPRSHRPPPPPSPSAAVVPPQPPHVVDFPAIEEYFQAAARKAPAASSSTTTGTNGGETTPISSASTTSTKKQAVTLIDSKRAYVMGILVNGKIKLPIEKIRMSILSMDAKIMGNEEVIGALRQCLPTPDDVALLQAYRASGRPDSDLGEKLVGNE